MAAAFIALSLAVAAVWLVGLASAAAQLAFVTGAYRVQGMVVSEWRYRMYGRTMRYYRVEFQLRNGQRAELRGGARSSWGSPRVGELVPVLVRERSGLDPKAKIGTWPELWFVAGACFFLGTVGVLALWPHLAAVVR